GLWIPPFFSGRAPNRFSKGVSFFFKKRGGVFWGGNEIPLFWFHFWGKRFGGHGFFFSVGGRTPGRRGTAWFYATSPRRVFFFGDGGREDGSLGYGGRGEEFIGRTLQAGRVQRRHQHRHHRRTDRDALPHSSHSSEVRRYHQSTRGRSCGYSRQGRLFENRIS